jgi:hypothetical protein
MDSTTWYNIVYNKVDKSLWAIGEMSLIHFDNHLQMIKIYTEEDGLPNFQILNLIPDNKGNIWFCTDRSLHQLNSVTGTVVTLSDKDGFQPQAYTNWSHPIKDDAGQLYFFGAFDGNGIDCVNPENFVSTPSSVYLESLEVNQQPYPLSTGINNLGQLSMQYFENKISLKTVILDFFAKGKSRIRYKLEGAGREDWQYGPNYYIIRYEGLQPGNYRLIMQASNAANEFNGPEKVLFMHISVPWWETGWAYTIFAIAFASLVWGFVQYRSRA